jgi:FG-GAP-like repeat
MKARIRWWRRSVSFASCTAALLTAVLFQGGVAHAAGSAFLVGPPWSIAGMNSSNIVWYNSQDGEIQMWSMNHNAVSSAVDITDEQGHAAFVGPPWSIVAVADMNGDGNSDIVWHNAQTNETQIWLLNGNQIASRQTVIDESGNPILVGLPWSIVAATDMSGDGKADIVWHNAQTNETQIWAMNGRQIASRQTVIDESGNVILIGSPWSIAAATDMNADGKGDLVWYNSTTGYTQIWLMNGRQITSRQTVIDESRNQIPIGPPWRIAGASDINTDGTSDLVWHNTQDNETQIWFMNGNQISDRQDIVTGDPTPPPPGTRITLFTGAGCVGTEELEETNGFINPSGNIAFTEWGDNLTCDPNAVQRFSVNAAGNVIIGSAEWRISFDRSFGRFQLISASDPSTCLADRSTISTEVADQEVVIDPVTLQGTLEWVNHPVTYSHLVLTTTCDTSAANQQFAM